MAARNGIAGVNERKVDVQSDLFSSHFSSKNEIANWLQCDVGAYLDDWRVMSIYHLRDIVSGARRHIKSKEVKHIHIPQFE